jgi:hypothetical protein
MQHPDVGCVLQVYWLEHPYVRCRMYQSVMWWNEATLDTKWDVSCRCIEWNVIAYKEGCIAKA